MKNKNIYKALLNTFAIIAFISILIFTISEGLHLINETTVQWWALIVFVPSYVMAWFMQACSNDYERKIKKANAPCGISSKPQSPSLRYLETSNYIGQLDQFERILQMKNKHGEWEDVPVVRMD